MKTQLIVMGRTNKVYLKDAIAEYITRLARYTNFELIELPDVKVTSSWPKEKIRKLEAEKILARIQDRSVVVLLDEKGKHFTSMEFAKKISSVQGQGMGLCFVVAGSYGAHTELKKKADLLLALSNMTFSHQIIRPLFLEQLYRAFTIIRGEPYHNEG